MDDGDMVPAHLPNMDALRKLKSRQIDTIHSDPIFALKQLKSGPYRGHIQKIGLDPVYVAFALPVQSSWYNATLKNQRVVLCIDATGIGLRNLNSCERKSTLLYQISARGKTNSIINIV